MADGRPAPWGDPQAEGNPSQARGPVRPSGRVVRVGRTIARIPGSGIVFAPPRTAGFVLNTWWRSRLPVADGDPPNPRLSLALAAQVALDEAVLALVKGPRLYPTEADYAEVVSELEGALDLYRARGWLDAPTGYHREPPPLTDPVITRSWSGGLVHEHLAWPSGYEPYEDEPGGDRWLSFEANGTARARVLRGRPGRPWLVLVHGFGTGWAGADFFAFHVRRLSGELGLNLLMPILPLHGPRKAGHLGGRELMSFQLQNFVLGMAQAVWDVRRAITWARAHGATRVGVYGMSLGAYVAALLATVEPGLDLVIAGAPVCDIPALFDGHTPHRLRRQAAQRGLLKETVTLVHRVVSPLAAPPLVGRNRLFVFAGVGDRMSTLGQARRLWEHWGRPRAMWYGGSHTTFFLSKDVSEFLDRSLVSSGFVPRRVLQAADGDRGRVSGGRTKRPGSTG